VNYRNSVKIVKKVAAAADEFGVFFVGSFREAAGTKKARFARNGPWFKWRQTVNTGLSSLSKTIT
jgi:hypothetical protein